MMELQNLIGRTTHGLIALDMALQDRPEHFKRYAGDFLSITKEEAEEVFDFLIPSARQQIWGKISEAQSLLESPESAHKNQRDIYVTLRSLLDMMYAISRLA